VKPARYSQVAAPLIAGCGFCKLAANGKGSLTLD